VAILDEIVQRKKQEVKEREKVLPIETLMDLPTPEIRNFKGALDRDGISIIAEIKKKSPSAGLIRKDFDPEHIAKIYATHGANAISVLTDSFYFGGKQEDIIVAKKAVQIPIFRKEFIVDPYQVYESRAIGADAVLLIAAILGKRELIDFQKIAREIGLGSLIEVHTEEELDTVLEIHPEMIGINNQTSFRLKRKIPEGILTVSESGIDTKEEIQRLKNAGFNGVLIGESLLRAEDIGAKLQSLLLN
jgi:indole-3-glycerol phosphate synthase